jgi:hypothetical protein
VIRRFSLTCFWVLCLLLAYEGWKSRELIKSRPKFWKYKASVGWPRAAATFADGRVQVWHGQYRGWVGKRIEAYSIFAKFTYQAEGGTYHGWHWKWLGGCGQEEADNLLQSFRQGPLYVRYRPSKPKNYVCDPFRDVRP